VAKQPKNKMELIRKALTDDPDGTPSEIAERLKEKGVVVSNAYVSTVKWGAKKAAKAKPKRKYKRRRKATTIRRVSVSTLTDVVGLLSAAKALAKQAGGVAQARTLLDLLDDD
jgi:arginine repressor